MILDLKSCDWDVTCHIYIEMGFRKASRNYKDLTIFLASDQFLKIFVGTRLKWSVKQKYIIARCS